MKSLSVEQQKALVLNLVKKDPELAKQLLDNLFEFENIADLTRPDFKLIWFHLPRKSWHLALRGASDKLLLFIRSCQTQQSFDGLMLELKTMGPQPRSAVLKAQNEILQEIQELSKQGKININRK